MLNRFHVMGGLAVVILPAATAWACSGCTMARDTTLPGFWLLSPGAAAALYVLAALIERPFLSWAGVNRHTLSHSLVAGAVTMFTLGIVGVLVYAMTWPTGFAALWIPGSIVASAVVKQALLRRRFAIGGPVRLGPIMLGVLVSHIAVALLPLLQRVFDFHGPRHATNVQAIQPIIGMITFLVAAAAVVVAFVRTRGDSVGPMSHHGFEVIPVATIKTPGHPPPPPAVPVQGPSTG